MSSYQESPVGSAIDPLVRLREFEDLFGHRWDALALLCLADGPLRFNRLAAAMNQHADERLADGVLSRSLRRLANTKLLTRTEMPDNGHAYALTAAGVTRAERLAECLQAMPTWDA